METKEELIAKKEKEIRELESKSRDIFYQLEDTKAELNELRKAEVLNMKGKYIKYISTFGNHTQIQVLRVDHVEVYSLDNESGIQYIGFGASKCGEHISIRNTALINDDGNKSSIVEISKEEFDAIIKSF